MTFRLKQVCEGMAQERPAAGMESGKGMGEGFSSVSIVGKYIYTMGDIGD